MRILVHTSRIIVGLLFIFSGLIKANDPLGLAYKMQEFFEVWGRSGGLKSMMHFLDQYALAFSIITITFEIVAGVALLTGWRFRLFSLIVFVLMIFFTFLTGYALFSGNIKTCGCFGDCIPLTAQQSFIKDLILLVLIILLLVGAKHVRPLFSSFWNVVTIGSATLLVLLLQWYVLRNLPILDCLPFKKGNNVLELRKMPPNAKPPKLSYVFIYEKGGEKKEFADMNNLPDSSWNFVERKEVVVEPGENNIPLINDFFLFTKSGTDTTEALMSKPGNYYLLFLKDPEDETPWLEDFKKVVAASREKSIPVFVVASQVEKAVTFFNVQHKLGLTVLACDVTAIKTAARTNPTLYQMNGPVVVEKWGKAGFGGARP
jgi:uncharacterized membrane protein YphA (DoxX/SURF4 family)